MISIKTYFYSELPEGGGPGDITGLPIASSIIVTDVAGIDIDVWSDRLDNWSASAIIPPYDPMDPERTSRCADMARTRLEHVGVVVAGRGDREREEFFLWAQENKFSPIVLLPHRQFDRKRQIAQLSVPKYINASTWVHLPGPGCELFDPSVFTGIFTTGEEFRRQI